MKFVFSKGEKKRLIVPVDGSVFELIAFVQLQYFSDVVFEIQLLSHDKRSKVFAPDCPVRELPEAVRVKTLNQWSEDRLELMFDFPGFSGVKRSFPSAASFAYIRSVLAQECGLSYDRLFLLTKDQIALRADQLQQRLFGVSDLEQQVFQVFAPDVIFTIKCNRRTFPSHCQNNTLELMRPFSLALRICDLKAQLARDLNFGDHLCICVERCGTEALPDEDALGLYENETFVIEYRELISQDYYFTDLQDRFRILAVSDPNFTFRQIASRFDKIPERCGFEFDGRDLELSTPVFSVVGHPLKPISIYKKLLILDIASEDQRGRKAKQLELAEGVTVEEEHNLFRKKNYREPQVPHLGPSSHPGGCFFCHARC
jgi:hypothetical protein